MRVCIGQWSARVARYFRKSSSLKESKIVCTKSAQLVDLLCMDAKTDLQKLRYEFCNERPPEEEKTQERPPSNLDKVRVLHDYIELLLKEGYPYKSIAGQLTRHGVCITESTLKSYVSQCRSAAKSSGGVVVDEVLTEPEPVLETEVVEAKPLVAEVSRERMTIPRPDRNSPCNDKWKSAI